MSMWKPLMFSAVAVASTVVPPASADEWRADGPALEIGVLVDEVLARNAGLASTRAALDAYEARAVSAGALDDPMLTVSAAPNTFGSGVGARGQLQVSQTLPWWGTLDQREAAARETVAAAAQDVDALRRELHAAAIRAFAEWHFVHVALAVNARHQQLLTEIREVAIARYAAGQAPQQDVLQAELERMVLRRQAFDLESARAAARARLNALLNRPGTAPLPLPATPRFPQSLPPHDRLLTAVVDEHPAVRGLQHRVYAARAQVRLARIARRPELRVSAGYNGVMDPVEKRLMAGVALTLPLNQRRRRADIDRARADERRSQFSLDDRRATLAAELYSAYAAAELALRSLALYRDELVPLARRTSAVATAEYASGAGDFLRTLAAERHRLEVALGAARAETELARSLAELARLAGVDLLDEVNDDVQ